MREASKGRPKGSLCKSTTRSQYRDSNDSVRSQGEPTSVEPFSTSSALTSSNSPPGTSVRWPTVVENYDRTSGGHENARKERDKSVASELEDMFDEDFKDVGSTKSNAFQESLAAFHRKVSEDHASTLESILGSPVDGTPRRTVSYAQLLYTMTQGLVEMLSVRFGSLGCYQLQDPSSRFYAVSLANDDTPSMFEPRAAEPANPLDAFDGHRTVQMLEVWFAVHPLSNIFSKTLLLRSYKNGTHDPLLLAVMLADACYVHEDDTTQQQRESLFEWTAGRLYDRMAVECGLSTVQMLMLLGWHELCLSHARRATCYLGYAGRVATRLQVKCIQMPETGLSQVNGIDVAQVEAEIVRNIYWLTFSITLWCFMQIDQPYPQLLPSTIPVNFPPEDESLSIIVKLDIASDNVSTLAKQVGMIHELWPLSHIASTTAHIYALLPRKQDMEETAQPGSWQYQPLHQLRQLLSANQNISTLCINIRKVLINAVKMLEANVMNLLSKALVLTAYHTTIIHLLFPRLEPSEDRAVVTEEMLDQFLISSRGLQHLFSVVDAEHDTDHLITRIRSSTFADVFVLGLDVCSRAIHYFYRRLRGGSPLEVERISAKAADLTTVASDMHAASKSETLLTAKNLRLIKKKVKEVKLLFSSLEAGQRCGDFLSKDLERSQAVTPQMPDFPSIDSFEAHSELWPIAAPTGFNLTPFDMSSGSKIHAFSQVGWRGDVECSVKVPARSANANSTGADQEKRTESPLVLEGDSHGLENMGMDLDFADLGFLGGADGWPDLRQS